MKNETLRLNFHWIFSFCCNFWNNMSSSWLCWSLYTVGYGQNRLCSILFFRYAFQFSNLTKICAEEFKQFDPFWQCWSPYPVLTNGQTAECSKRCQYAANFGCCWNKCLLELMQIFIDDMFFPRNYMRNVQNWFIYFNQSSANIWMPVVEESCQTFLKIRMIFKI